MLTFAFSSPMLFMIDQQRENGALLIACIVAAIRLRGEPIERMRLSNHTVDCYEVG